MTEPHKWSMNITCPKCGHTGEAEESFPCCEHVAQLEATQAALVGALEGWHNTSACALGDLGRCSTCAALALARGEG